jgi:Trk K+ transport system NAD-binding subunit
MEASITDPLVGFDQDMKSRIIVCGLDRTGYKILRLLRQQEVFAIGVNDRPIPDDNVGIIVGDLQAASTLERADIREAQTLVLAGSDESLNLRILMQARVLNPRIRIVNRLFNTSLGARLDHTLDDHVTLSVAALAAPVFAFTAMGKQAVGQLSLFHETWPVHEEYIDDRHPWRGRRLCDLWEDRHRMLIYYLANHRNLDLVSAVIDGHEIEVGDRLLIATPPSKRNSPKSFSQKLIKLVDSLKHLQQQARSMLIVVLILLLTILTATVIYTCFQSNVSVVDAIYFSMGMITGAGGNEQVVERSSDSIKIFTIVTMLLGAAVIGIWYALLNEFILGTHFKQFWKSVPIPQRNHYIICGLGSVGVQIARQLTSYGHEVVVIERDRNNRFLNTVRSLKISLILEDASLASTLKLANLNEAEAILAVTSNDNANLEIALNAKGFAPKVPAILRYEDPDFAQMAQQVFQFDHVLSPPDIVAPAFAAVALGGRILGNGIIGDDLWVSLATLITPNHPFAGKCVKEAARAVGFVPLYMETTSQTIHGWELLENYLSAGDILYLTIPASKLEQLWQVTPVRATQ